MLNKLTVCSFLVLFVFNASAQNTYIDKKGVWRWKETGKEVCAFGVNYTVPFAHAFRTAKRLGVDMEKAIDVDVYHFARLGLNAFRVHVWDTEISDTLGNLLDNEHLRLFDYLIFKMKSRGMKFIITPIAYWGNGWPEPDEATPGFSARYGKDACLEDPQAIAAQQRYLAQFVSHVNRYTGLAYKDDPDVLAFEVSNEPHHKGTAQQVTDFINGMVKAIRKTGCKKPIFYNVTHSIELAQAYFQANIQGGTYQWYPTGLGSRHALQGNLLPHVDHYPVPFSNLRGYSGKTKVVYEFDAADCAASYIYPAMARSFRTAGMQVATHFSYDPSYMAHLNTEYGTHYMNLLYTPNKAIGLMIAAEAFRTVPLNKSYGSYPDNVSFENIYLDQENDLALLNSVQKFFYSRTTDVEPLNVSGLLQIAGAGSSPIVHYDGTGAYFLDKISDGLWRLEVLPDAAWLTDPFDRTSPEKRVACLVNNYRNISIHLPDLSDRYFVYPLSRDTLPIQAHRFSFKIFPGTYLLSDKRLNTLPDDLIIRNLRLREYALPEKLLLALPADLNTVVHEPRREITAGREYRLSARVITTSAPEAVRLYYHAGGRQKSMPMMYVSGFTYECVIPAEDLSAGIMEYFIAVTSRGITRTFPDGAIADPSRWDFYYSQSFTTRIVPSAYPIYLFKAEEDHSRTLRMWAPSQLIPLPSGNTAWKIILDNPQRYAFLDTALKKYLYPIRFYCGDILHGRMSDRAEKSQLIIRVKTNLSAIQMHVGLADSRGAVYGKEITVGNKWNDHAISMSSFEKYKLALLPRGYPVFLPFWFDEKSATQPVVTKPENLQMVLIIPEQYKNQPIELEIESVWLE